MENQNSIKVAGFLLLIVSVPTFVSITFFSHSLSILNVVLLLAVGIAMVHPYLGLPNFVEVLDLQQAEKLEPIAPKEDLKPVQQEFTKPDTYIDNLPELRQKLLQYTDLEKEPAGDSQNAVWSQVLSQQKNGFSIQVHKRKETDFFFRVVVDFEATMAETFDFMGDISKRATWDEVAESSGTVERISNKTSINVRILFTST